MKVNANILTAIVWSAEVLAKATVSLITMQFNKKKKKTQCEACNV